MKWEHIWFSKERHYWEQKTSKRKLFDDVSHQNGILSATNWSNFPQQKLKLYTGFNSIIKYEGNFQNSLKYLFSDVEWKTESFRLSKFWNQKQNQRMFMDSLAMKLGIKEFKYWGNITKEVFCEHGGFSLLNYYNGSLRNALQSIYPGISLDSE